MRFKFAFWVLLALAIGLAGCGGSPFKFHGTQLQPPLSVPDLALTNQDGQTARLTDYHGKLVLLFFGYTHCQDACPLTLAEFKNIRDGLGADAARVRFVFVTVDPLRDTPEQLKEYLAQFDSSFIGLTGSSAALTVMYRAYGVGVEKILAAEHSPSGMSATLDHTSSVYLLDDQSQVRLIYTDIPWQDMAADIRFLLNKQG